AIEHARDVFRRVGGNSHERGDPDVECGHADLTAGLEREARMLEVDIERVEAGGMRNSRDLHGPHQPHRHGGNDLVARKLLLDAVAQDVAYRHAALPSSQAGLVHAPALCCRRERKGTETIHELHDRLQVDRAGVSAEEWQARVDLAACYRLVDKYGMTDLIYNHITARIPGSKDHLLINLYGML